METSCTITNCFGGSIALTTTTAYTTQTYNSIADVPQAMWQQIVPQEHTFLNYDYLIAFEACCSVNMGFKYVVFRKDGRLAGVATFQTILFDGNNVGTEESRKELGFWPRLLNSLVSRMKMRLLVLGNTFMTGEYGWYFTDVKAPGVEEVSALQLVIKDLVQEAKASKRPVSGLLVKEVFADKLGAFPELQKAGYLQFQVQPDMILDIDPEWKTFDGYLAAMSSKYRVRMRKAVKDMNGIEIRRMTVDEIVAHMPEMERLYQEVVDTSDFKLATFRLQHVQYLMHQMPESFWIDGFWLEDKLLSFISFYQHNGQIVAGMMGMDREAQKQYDLYLNVLLLVARRGIEHGARQSVFGRTAMEIKSSVGATPHDMYLYTRHVSVWKNRIIMPMVKLLSRNEPWKQRNPFK
jgi:hypothetical protein